MKLLMKIKQKLNKLMRDYKFLSYLQPLLKLGRYIINVICLGKHIFLLQIEYRERSQQIIYLFGLTEGAANMGDIAQYYCIKEWLGLKYPESKLFCFSTYDMKIQHYKLLRYIKKHISSQDMIFIMSGYNTHDINGGYQEGMHQKVIETFKNNAIIILPQTVNFMENINAERASNVYSNNSNILFFARDTVSFKKAEKIFKGIKVEKQQDIVITLIANVFLPRMMRKGVALCYRNDTESYYSIDDYCLLEKQIETIDNVYKVSTVKRNIDASIALNNPYKYIKQMILEFANKRVTITDKLHGTIFSLIAGTPVIILKTTDQKVIECGKELSKLYPSYVFLAKDICDAFDILKEHFDDHHSNDSELFSVRESYFANLNDKLDKWLASYEKLCKKNENN